jgi:HSP20 family protein
MIFDTWAPFFDVGKTLEEMDRLFGVVGRPLGLRSVPRGTFPAINIYDQGESLVLTAEVPGMNPENMDLNVQEEGTVTLKGGREEPEIAEEHRYYRRERMTGAFNRTIALPVPIDSASVKAQYKDGILKVRMAKAPKAKAHQIPIGS